MTLVCARSYPLLLVLKPRLSLFSLFLLFLFIRTDWSSSCRFFELSPGLIVCVWLHIVSTVLDFDLVSRYFVGFRKYLSPDSRSRMQAGSTGTVYSFTYCMSYPLVMKVSLSLTRVAPLLAPHSLW